MKGHASKGAILAIVLLLVFSGLSSSTFANINSSKRIQIYNHPFKPSEISNYDYVIITSNDLKYSNFQILLYYKSQFLNATIVTIEDIINNPDYWVDGIYGDATSQSNGNPWVEDGKQVTSNYETFNDTQAKVRNFIRFACLEWETKYVLLGGDVDILPARKLRIDDAYWFSGAGYIYIDANIRSDLYFGALHGTFNDDFDEFFGEDEDYSIRDEADLNAEVYIGRAPVSANNEVKAFVDKVIHYETHEKPNNIQLHQAGINQINNPDSTEISEACAQLIPGTYNIHKLYSINERVTIEKWVNSFRTPDKSIILHIGSGHEYYYYTYRAIGDDIEFSVSEVNQLDNTFYPIHISISCNSGDFGFTEDCLAEKMLVWEYGGPSACIFNTHYGFATDVSTLDYSGEFIVRQFYEIFQNGTENIGKVMQFSKDYFVNSALNDKGYRWCIYTINLLGDPEMPVFEKRDEPPIYDIVYVDDDFNSSTPGWGKDHFDSIQDGINAVFDNGFVYVYNGLYSENIVINKVISLIGEDKETTIIEGGQNYNTVTINMESVLIQNFTITQVPTISVIGYNGIMVHSYCNSTEIYNNIITGNKEYGVLIIGSCHNKIHYNEINNNGFGIGLLNPEGNSNSPCDNVISQNTISQSDSVGLFIFFADNNHIRKNIFENNCMTEQYQGINPNAFFVNPLRRINDWTKNTWDGSNKFITAIYGRRGVTNQFTMNIGEDVNIGILGIEFDINIKSKSRTYSIFEILELILTKFLNK
jgi:parallel beta-helix repeat protein